MNSLSECLSVFQLLLILVPLIIYSHPSLFSSLPFPGNSLETDHSKVYSIEEHQVLQISNHPDWTHVIHRRCFRVRGDPSGGSGDKATGGMSVGHLGTSFPSSNPEPNGPFTGRSCKANVMSQASQRAGKPFISWSHGLPRVKRPFEIQLLHYFPWRRRMKLRKGKGLVIGLRSLKESQTRPQAW